MRDLESKPYLLIECKTANQDKNSKNSEFSKEWDRMQESGGQLFSYFQQERAVKFLCLYTSDFVDSNLTYQNYIIQSHDNEEYLIEKEIEKSYQKANNVNDLFEVWRESYEGFYLNEGIFESNYNAYQVLKANKIFENLKELKEEGKYHEFAKILRKHNISGKENAFDKLVNIFLCKIYDETFRKDNLAFGYRGVMADSYANMQDRLMLLYKEAMSEFLGEKITFVSNDDIEKSFKKLKVKALKDAMKNYIKELKFYSNNDFAFLEVHNKELFLKNALVLREVVELFAPYKLTQNSTNQFLGNLFELFLQKGMKQDEGQFFTPIQICEFIIYSLPLDTLLQERQKPLRVIDYACGAGHFLNTYASELKRYIPSENLQEHYKNIYGIEKEYRLSKVSKVSSAMYGQNDINILFADALSSYELANPTSNEGEKAKLQIEPHSFDLLIANPPYSVKGFLETLSQKSKKTYTLFTRELNTESNNAIECFFIERAKQLLSDNAYVAIILPSSILNKDSIYKSTREIILQNFDIIAIAELGSQTFGATGTNTIILFLHKKESFKTESEHIAQEYSLIKDRIDSENLADNEGFSQNYLSDYTAFRGFDRGAYERFLRGDMDSALLESQSFKDYKNAFNISSEYKKLKDSKDYKDSQDKQELEDKAFLDFALKIEKDKLLYFSLSLNKEVLVIKAPSDNKEQKRFLGYEWSNKKGSEGLKELNKPYLSPLFERDNPTNPNKLNFLVREAFNHTLESIPKELEPYAFRARLVDMLDFEKVEFNKAISLNPIRRLRNTPHHSEYSRHSEGALATEESFFLDSSGFRPQNDALPFANCKYELVRLGEIALEIQTAKRPDGGVGRYDSGALSLGGEHIDNTSGYVKLDSPKYVPIEFYEKFKTQNKGIVKKDDILLCKDGALTGKVALVRDEFTNQKVMINEHIFLIRCDSEIKQKYLFFILHSNIGQNLLKSKITGSAQGGLNQTNLKSIQIPLPPIEIQKQIVKECEKVEKQYQTIRMSIEKYQELIKAILAKCAITESSADNASIQEILTQLNTLESSLDFDLLFECLESTNADSKDISGYALNMTESRHSNLSTRHSEVLAEESLLLHSKESYSFRHSEALAEESKNIDSSNTESKAESTSLKPLNLKALLDSLPTPPPQGWERVKFQNIAKSLSAGGDKPKVFSESKTTQCQIPIYANATQNKGLYGYTDKATITQNAITISARGSIGYAVARFEPFVPIVRLIVLIPDEKIANLRFLEVAINNSEIQNSGSNIPQLTVPEFANLQIPLPPLQAQEQIVVAIEKVEKRIALIDSSLESLESKKTEILQTMLEGSNEREREREQSKLKIILKKLESHIARYHAQKAMLVHFIHLILEKSGITHFPSHSKHSEESYSFRHSEGVLQSKTTEESNNTKSKEMLESTKDISLTLNMTGFSHSEGGQRTTEESTKDISGYALNMTESRHSNLSTRHSEALAEESLLLHSKESYSFRHSEALAEESKNLDSNNTESKAESTLLKPLNLKAMLDSLPTPPPQGWDRIRLGDIAQKITKGTTPTTLGYSFLESGVNFIKVESISENGGLILDKITHISQECHDALERSQLQENDILFSIAGALGRVAIIDSKILPANTNQALSIIRLKPNIYNIKFIAKTLKTPDIQKQIEGFKKDIAQQNLSLEQMGAIQIPLPPLESQKQIINVINTIEEKKSLMDSSLEGLEGKKSKILKSALEST